MKLIVQKFGGTSVASEDSREKVAQKIINTYNSGYSIVVVVSAIGRKGAPYATDTLLGLVDKDIMEKRHTDLLIACGEIISSVVLSNILNKKGYKTLVLTGPQAGIITNKDFGKASVIKVKSNRILEGLEDGKIVIVTGFQGATEEGEITTLGRGGSDTSAVLLGEALNCEHVEIYTDVDGIMTADPRVVPEARVLNTMRYKEVYQLAEDGAKVIHPRAVEVAERSNIPLVIKNTLTESEGTFISSNEGYDFSNYGEEVYDNLISSITYKKDRAQVLIYEFDDSQPLEVIMENITEKKISIDMINFLGDRKVFTIDQKDVRSIKKILDGGKCSYNIVENCAKLSLIGHKIRGIPGVMSRIVKAFSIGNIRILQTSDSYTTIWCLITDEDLVKGIRILHKEFNLDKK